MVTFLASIGTGAITNGIYFLTESALGYGRTHNYALALVIGICYIVGALGIGPTLARAAGRFGSTRTIVVILLTVLATLCFAPIIGARGISRPPPAWSIWLTGAGFGGCTGCLWPIIEGYITGGRRDARLRSAIGAFNIVWATAVILSLWLIAPYVKNAPLMVFFWIGAVHAIAAVLFLKMPSEPPRHLDDSPHVVMPMSRKLLRSTRLLLPGSYVLIASLSPAVPVVLGQLSIDLSWKGPLFSVWLAARLLMFITLERTHRWQGKRLPPVAAGIGLIISFAAIMLSPRVGDMGLLVFVMGLIAFGLSAGVVYVAALYYGMEVGGSRVDDGGWHEAIIGLGYAGGPACGLFGFMVIPAAFGSPDMAVVVIVGLIATFLVAAAIRTMLGEPRRSEIHEHS